MVGVYGFGAHFCVWFALANSSVFNTLITIKKWRKTWQTMFGYKPCVGVGAKTPSTKVFIIIAKIVIMQDLNNPPH